MPLTAVIADLPVNKTSTSPQMAHLMRLPVLAGKPGEYRIQEQTALDFKNPSLVLRAKTSEQ